MMTAAREMRPLTFMALPKGDKLELIVQKCCELGVWEVIPFVSRYCVAQKSKKDRNKTERLNRISEEACKQCGRSIPMKVRPAVTFREMLKELEHYENRNALKAEIENRGGKVAGSVSARTTALINNDAASSSSKNKTAKSLGVTIITEDEFINTYLKE